MDGLVVILVGLVALGGAIGTLRSFGPRFRVGRLLSTAPVVSIGEAIELARSGRAAYVRVSGRIDSEQEFEDADHRPLVLRRTRFQARSDGRWTNFDLVRETVPFELREGLDAIAVTGDDLDIGLVVVPRETVGIVEDLGDRAPAHLDVRHPARVIVEQVSSVEHALIAGVPSLAPDGSPRIGAGLGRPLILTTLEQPEAMRILAEGASRRPRVAAALIVAAAACLIVGILMLATPGSALAASPDPTYAAGSDTRSSGQGPGLVGAPLVALLIVAGIAAFAVVVTLIFIHATGGPRRPDQAD